MVASISDVTQCIEGSCDEQMWVEAMLNDVDLRKVMEYVSKGWPEKKKIKDSLLPFFQVMSELSVVDDLLYRNEQCVPPQGVRKVLIVQGHKSHLGMSSLKKLLRQYYWWPAMDTEAERFVRNCTMCIDSDKNCSTHDVPLTNVTWPIQAWQKIGIDISGPFNELPVHMRNVIVMIDYHSKWSEICFTENVTTDVVLKFMKDTFSREGLPETIVSDNGVQFVSNSMQSFLKENNISHIQTALYDPRCNGQVERFNRFLKDCVKLAVKQNDSTCPLDVVRERVWSYNITPHSTTGVSPFLLLRGREPTSGVCPNWFKRIWSPGPERDIRCLVNSAKNRVESCQGKTKSRHDARTNVSEVNFKVGDLVKIRLPRHVKKGHSAFSRPLKIVKVNKGSVVTQDGKCWSHRRMTIFKGVGSSDEESHSQNDYDGESHSQNDYLLSSSVSSSKNNPLITDWKSTVVERQPVQGSSGIVAVQGNTSGSQSHASFHVNNSIAERVKDNPRLRIPTRKIMEGFE